MVSTVEKSLTLKSPCNQRSVDNIHLSEFSHDRSLIQELEKTGKQWIMGIYTNRLNDWKDTWKSSRCGEGKNQSSEARLRTEDDLLLTEGMVGSVPSLTDIEEVKPIFTELNGPMNAKMDGGVESSFSPAVRRLSLQMWQI